MSKKSESFIDKYVVGKKDWLLKHKEVIAKLLDEYETEQLNLACVTQRSELLKALNGIIACCDGNNSAHEEIYHIANDAVKAFNCG